MPTCDRGCSIASQFCQSSGEMPFLVLIEARLLRIESVNFAVGIFL